MHEQRTAHTGSVLRDCIFGSRDGGPVSSRTETAGPRGAAAHGADALAVEEKPDWSSRARENHDAAGHEVAVMHACGHDAHMAPDRTARHGIDA